MSPLWSRKVCRRNWWSQKPEHESKWRVLTSHSFGWHLFVQIFFGRHGRHRTAHISPYCMTSLGQLVVCYIRSSCEGVEGAKIDSAGEWECRRRGRRREERVELVAGWHCDWVLTALLMMMTQQCVCVPLGVNLLYCIVVGRRRKIVKRSIDSDHVLVSFSLVMMMVEWS